jgi:type IV pilus assembly protein PilC
MPNYTWKGKSRGGKVQEGVIVADSKEAVVSMLRRQQIIVTAVTEKGKEFALPKFGSGVKKKELAIFARQFSVMIDAGLPLVQCLEILGNQQGNRTFQKVLFQVRQDIEAGSSLADALRRHPRVYDDLYCNMVAAGEAGGILDTILQRLSTYIEKNVKLRGAVRSALIYPTAVIAIAAIVVWVILTWVIPVFATLYQGLGVPLPFMTRATIGASRLMARWWWLILIAIGAGIFALNRYHATPQGRLVLDGLLLRVPIIGTLLRKIAVARFCRTLGTLLSSGVPILDGLEITARTSGNAVVEEAILSTRRSVEQGKTVADPLKETAVFPPMVVQMVAVGEHTGALDTMLSKIADFYEDEVDEATANLLALLEPAMIMVLGVIIGGIVVSMYLPLFGLISQIG